jgi:mono/diheme cytochrome c family protein
LEDRRVSSRSRLAFVAGLLFLVGCGDSLAPGPIAYPKNERLMTELPEKPQLRAAISKTVDDLYGASPKLMKVPLGAPLTRQGILLANTYEIAGTSQVHRSEITDAATGKPEPIAGGYAIYRKQCLHCHGISGDGAGPTAEFLFPRPRDFRRGIFKFTSTTGMKPTRDDLRKTLLRGLPNTSMAPMEALLSPSEIEQVLDYTIFLSLRGETELGLLNEASVMEEEEAPSLSEPELTSGILDSIFDNWASADEQVLKPGTPRVKPTKESILRGRALFLGETPEKLECAGCHGSHALGNGPSYIDPETFNQYVFGTGPPEERFAKLKEIAEKSNKKWGDEWGNPLRPADLTLGVYKGGRRPIDIYWRIAKGITGTPMPAHASAFQQDADRKIWDLVNFVLALPYDKALLKDIPSNVQRDVATP